MLLSKKLKILLTGDSYIKARVSILCIKSIHFYYQLLGRIYTENSPPCIGLIAHMIYVPNVPTSNLSPETEDSSSRKTGHDHFLTNFMNHCLS